MMIPVALKKLKFFRQIQNQKIWVQILRDPLGDQEWNCLVSEEIFLVMKIQLDQVIYWKILWWLKKISQIQKDLQIDLKNLDLKTKLLAAASTEDQNLLLLKDLQDLKDLKNQKTGISIVLHQVLHL
mgnify:CR=1 FL=1